MVVVGARAPACFSVQRAPCPEAKPRGLTLPLRPLHCRCPVLRLGGGTSLQRGRCSFATPVAARASSMDMPQHMEGDLHADDLVLALVVGRFNDLVTKPLLEGALSAVVRHGGRMEDVTVVHVPGSFEIPLVAKRLAASGNYDAVVCIGAVVRGSTTHYEAVANSAASGCMSAGLDTGVPVIFGVLTCESMEQALDRAGGKLGNKGYEAMVTAIEMASLMHQLDDAEDAEDEDDDDDDDDDEDDDNEDGPGWTTASADDDDDDGQVGAVGR